MIMSPLKAVAAAKAESEHSEARAEVSERSPAAVERFEPLSEAEMALSDASNSATISLTYQQSEGEIRMLDKNTGNIRRCPCSLRCYMQPINQSRLMLHITKFVHLHHMSAF